MIEFGEKLKHLREEKGMTQQTLADLLYVTRQAVSRWECGARYPDLMTAKRIAEVLETSIVDVLNYGISFAAMAAGIYYSVKNELSPHKTGIIMSTGFLYTVFSFIGGCIIIMVTGNGEIAPYSYVLLAGNVIAIIIVNRFFWIGRQGKPIWVYVTALALLGQEGWHFKRMMEAVGIDTAEEKGLVFVVLLLGAAGQIATAGLLMYQAYTLDKKRKQVSL